MSAAAARIGVLGGTFDPPHLGHLVLGAVALRALRLDRVLFIPAGDPWRKAAREVTLAADRVAMVRAAVEGLPWAAVDPLEVEREGPTHSADTMEALAARGGQWWLVGGADVLTDLPHWHEPERLLAACRLAVAPRSGRRAEPPPETLTALPEVAGRVDPLPMARLDIASTALRERLMRGESPEVLLPAGVRRVIAERGLYAG